jgi:hypothetical protein
MTLALELAATVACAAIVVPFVWSRIRSQRWTMADEQRWRRLATAERVQRESHFGEWWSTR